MTQIQLYRSKVAGRRPTSLADGRLFINQADGVLCWTDASGNLQTTPLEGLVQSASPQFTGTPQAPTAAPNDNSQRIATTAYVFAALSALIANAPGALNTLKELADAINDDSNFAGTVTAALGNRLRVDAAQSLTGAQQVQARSNAGAAASGANGDITGLSGLTTALSLSQGGTGATSALAALAALGGVQNGTGIGQNIGNQVKTGWSGASLKATVDNTDLGNVWTDYISAKAFSGNGYVKLPIGLIVQWGGLSAQSDVSIPFPTTFPNSCFTAIASVDAGNPSVIWSVTVDQINKSSFAVRPRYASGGNVYGASASVAPYIYWLSIGY